MISVKKKPENVNNLIVSGSLKRAIWTLSWPLMVRMTAVSIASFTDIFIAGKMGSETQAAIGICAQVWFFLLMITVALSAGTTAIVSRYWGAQDRENAIEAARHSLLFAVIFGSLTIAVGLVVAKPLLSLLGASQSVVDIAWTYIQIDILSQLPFTVVWIAHSILRAKGDTKSPMINWVLMTLLIVSLDCLFCLSPLNMGVEGIAYSWLITSIFGVVLATHKLIQSDIRECVSLKRTMRKGFSSAWLVRLMKIGLPACISDLSWTLGCFALFLIFATTSHPTECQASWAIGLRLEEIVSYMPVYALSTACATIVGQNLGANKADRAKEAGWLVCIAGISFTLIVALGVTFAAEPIALAMSSDALVVEYTTRYFQIIGLSQPFVAIWIILFGAMQGAGYTRWPMWVSIFGFAVLRLPLAWLLTNNITDGPIGCWIAFAATSVVLALLTIKKYNSNQWQLQTI